MTSVELRFPANRYHGTAWGRHVNEGIAEWPPSPYRLLRAMYDAWKRKCSGLDASEVQALFEALASQPPTFHTSRVVAAHTRSYLNSNTEDPSDKALIFDGFVVMPPESRCFLRWDFDLDAGKRRNLAALLSSLNYLGRSESWVEARLADTVDGDITWKPWVESSAPEQNLLRVACPVPRSEYRHKKPSWFDALAYSTGMLLKDKVSDPPALRYVPYVAPEDGVTTWLPARRAPTNPGSSAAILEFSGKVLPGTGDTIRVAERIRGRLMRYFETRGEDIPAMVHGKDAARAPLRDHSHLFILPRGNRLQRIDHAMVYTRDPKGFASGVEDAIANVKAIRWIEGIRCVSSWFGRADDPGVRPMARRVKSSTPFVTVRHWRKGRDTFIEDEIRRECENHKLPPPVSIRRLSDLAVTRFRRNREDEPSRPGYAVEIEFPEPVQTPFSLGYACHYGLGQFEKE